MGYIRYTGNGINPILKGCEVVQEYEIEFYSKPDGTEPAKDFILELDKKMRAKNTVQIILQEGRIQNDQLQ